MRVTRFAVDDNERALFPDYFIVDDNQRTALAMYSANIDVQTIVDEGLAMTPWLSTQWPGRTVSFDEWRNAFARNGYSFPQYHKQIGDRVRISELVDINRAFVELFMNGVDLADPLNAQTHRELLKEQNVDLFDFLK
jgi:hypothetical protein